jgi:hypothetical protein
MLGATSFTIPKPMGKTSIIIKHPPLDASYMMKINIKQGFCCEYKEKKTGGKIHSGIDIEVPAGGPVYGIVDGIVIRNRDTWDENNYWNSFLIIEHECSNGEKFYVYYGHIFSSFKKFEKVKAGEKIGTIKHDKTGECGDHLHLGFGFGNNLIHCGWGYCYTCEETKAEGFVNPLNYLTFTGPLPTDIPISCDPEPTPEPTPTPTLAPIPARYRNMKFDVKTKFMEKKTAAVAKAGFISYIRQSDWAMIAEIGEDNSLWIKNYERHKNGNNILIELDFEIRSPAMFGDGDSIYRKSLRIEFDVSPVINMQSFRDPRLYDLIKKQLTRQHIPIPQEGILQQLCSIFVQVWGGNPSPYEALEGLIIGAHLMKTLEEYFTTHMP